MRTHKPLQEILDEVDNSLIYSPEDHKSIRYVKGKPGSVLFVPSDSYGNLQQKLKDYPDELEVYSRYPLEYQINKDSFRSEIEDYNFLHNQEVDIILGCSFTFGIGFHLEHTWPELLKKMLKENNNVPTVNLALPGAGGDTSFRFLITYLNKFKKIRRILHLQPFYARFEFLTDDIANSIHATDVETHPMAQKLFKDTMKREHIVNEKVHIINHYKNISACKGMADIHNIPYYYLAYGCTVQSGNPYEIYARDIDHGGLTGQYILAKEFYNKVKKEDTSIDFGVYNYGFLGNTPESYKNLHDFPFDQSEFVAFINNHPDLSKFYPNTHFNKHII